MRLKLPTGSRFYLAVILILILTAGLSIPSRTAAALTDSDPGPTVRVCLDDKLDQIEVGAQMGYEVVNLATGGVVGTVYGTQSQAAALTRMTARPAGVAVGSFGVFTGPIALRPVDPPSLKPDHNRVLAAGRPYRGELEIRNVDGKLDVINIVSLEDYLLGVVPKEMPSSWHPEALKAQAVAARTYAIYQLLAGKYKNRGYHMVDGVDSQVYGGVASEDPRSTKAIQDTRGQILTYAGQAINAFFHASSGGHTENSENVWGTALAYLKGVPDFDQASPRYQWTRSFSEPELTAKFEAAGYPLGTFNRLVPEGPTGVSGRWIKLAVEGGSGRYVFKSTQVRTILGLNSTFFSIIEKASRLVDTKASWGLTQSIAVQGAASKLSRPVSSARIISAKGRFSPLEGGLTVLGKRKAVGGLELQGRGWGHGLGMSQWGAKAMAEKGDAYQSILAYYYRDTKLEMINGSK